MTTYERVAANAALILRGGVVHLPGGVTAGAWRTAVPSDYVAALLGPRCEVLLLSQDAYETAREAERFRETVAEGASVEEVMSWYDPDGGGRRLRSDAEMAEDLMWERHQHSWLSLQIDEARERRAARRA